MKTLTKIFVISLLVAATAAFAFNTNSIKSNTWSGKGVFAYAQTR